MRKTYLYTIIDLEENIGGPDYWLFGKYDHRTPEGVAECLKDLESGGCQLSHRRSVKLDWEPE